MIILGKEKTLESDSVQILVWLFTVDRSQASYLTSTTVSSCVKERKHIKSDNLRR